MEASPMKNQSRSVKNDFAYDGTVLSTWTNALYIKYMMADLQLAEVSSTGSATPDTDDHQSVVEFPFC